jgi:hypothetical protein
MGLRPASWPFSSGDTYRSIARWTWDETDTPSWTCDQIEPYDTIFVSWYIRRFVHEWAPRIPVPFYLYSSNSDQEIDSDTVRQFEKTSGVHWWAANLNVRSTKATALPLGLQNESQCWAGDVGDFVRLKALSERTPKLQQICWGFTVGTNPAVRGAVKAALESNPRAVAIPPLDPFAYRRELIRYRYVASPPGNGPDCHRTWEALALGVTPVVLDCPMNRQFVEQGYPVILLSRPEDFGTFLSETSNP